MSVNIEDVLKSLGGQISKLTVSNIKAAAEKLTPEDIRIVEESSLRKAELLLIKLTGEDTTYDELMVDETLALIAGKAGMIAKETFSKTVLDVVTVAGKVVLKLVFGLIIPVPIP